MNLIHTFHAEVSIIFLRLQLDKWEEIVSLLEAVGTNMLIC